MVGAFQWGGRAWRGWWSGHGCGEPFVGIDSGTDDTRIVIHFSGGDGHIDIDVGGEQVEAIADAATDDYQVRGEDTIDIVEELIEASAETGPGHFVFFPGGIGDIMFCDQAMEMEVAEFRIGNEVAVDKKCGAQAAADGDEQDGTGAALAFSEPHFRHTGGIRIIECEDGKLGFIPQEGFDIKADPIRVDISGAIGDTMFDDCGETAAEERFPVVQFIRQFLDNGGNGGRGSWFWRGYLDPFRAQFTGGDIDDSAFDSGGTDIDTQYMVIIHATNFIRPAGEFPAKGGKIGIKLGSWGLFQQEDVHFNILERAVPGVGSQGGDSVEDIQAFDDLTEDGIFAIELRGSAQFEVFGTLVIRIPDSFAGLHILEGGQVEGSAMYDEELGTGGCLGRVDIIPEAGSGECTFHMDE